MAQISIRCHGNFFEAKGEEEIFSLMKNYYAMYKNYNVEFSENHYKNENGHTLPKASIKLNKILFSDCYEIVDGHHRMGILYLKNVKKINAFVVGEKTTFLQNMLFSCNQTHGDPELYQPVDRLEVSSWRVVRNCQDRFEMIENFLKQNNLMSEIESVLDVSCSYGWFLKEFSKKNINIIGVEKDFNAINVGKLIYNLEEKIFIQADAYDFLMENNQKYDLVLFLSILHHFALGKEKGGVEEILKRLDAITEKVLFLDTGQNHEEWYRKRLSNWDDEYIEKVLRENTTFTSIVKVGKDSDNRGYFRKQYGRTLFACFR
jgi:2-polyprenyl-3-methyl-5-hydroxy-6-metoxy-1,4-benzoquinol methylase